MPIFTLQKSYYLGVNMQARLNLNSKVHTKNENQSKNLYEQFRIVKGNNIKYSNEKQLKALFHSLNEFFIMVDAEGHLIWFNNMAKEMIHENFQKHLDYGKSLYDIIGKDLIEQFKEGIKYAKRGEILEYSAKIEGEQGNIQFSEITFNPVLIENGYIGAVAITCRDVTDKFEAEIQRKKMEDTYLNTIRSQPNLILKLRKENNSFIAIFGEGKLAEKLQLTTDKIHGKTLEQISGHKIYEEIKDNYFEAFQGKEKSFETKWKNHWYMVKLRPHKSKDDEITQIIAVIYQITEMKNIQKSLNKRQQQLRIVFESFPDPWFFLDTDLNIVSFNKASLEFMKLAGRDKIQIGDNILDYPHALAKESFKQLAEEALAGNRISKDVKIELLGENEKSTFELTFSPVFEKDIIIGITLIERDITTRIQAEKKTANLTNRLEKILSSISDVVWYGKVENGKMNLKFISPVIENICGFKAEEILSGHKDISDIIHPEDYNDFKNSFKDIHKRQSINHEFRIKDKNGYTKWMKDKIHIDCDKDNICRLYGVLSDKTENKKAQRKLKSSRDKYRLLAENGEDIVYRIQMKPRFSIEYISPSIKRLMNVSRKTFYENPKEFFGLISGGKTKNCNDFFFKDNNFQSKFVNKVEGIDGNDIWLQFINKPILNQEGDIIKVEGKAQDITAIKELQENLARAEKMEALGRLAGGVAHDLNNILSGMVTYPDLILLSMDENDINREYVEEIKESGLKASRTVQDLLTLARRGIINKSKVNINRMINKFLTSPEFLRIARSYPKISFDSNLESSLTNIEASEHHIYVSLVNLVLNAAEAIHSKGSIIISTKKIHLEKPIEGYDDIKKGSYVLLKVKDNGPGIAPEDIKKIFEPFYSKKDMGRSGTGLGLAIVWGMVSDHKGYIDVESKLGKGTTFNIYLPGGQEVEIPDKDDQDNNFQVGSSAKILIVDDEEPQRVLAQRILSRFGFETISKATGEAALEFLQDNDVDLILLDMILSHGIDGLETCKKIRMNKANQKIILVTGFAEPSRMKKARALGIDVCVKKPYSLNQIMNAVDMILAN